jgi:hypothetical protein
MDKNMAKMTTTADTYRDLDEWLGSRDAKKLAHNTTAERRPLPDGDAIAVRLHSTDVVTFHADNTITLNSGGWRTVTTKDRINAVLPAPLKVYSSDGVWTLQRMGNAPAVVSEFYDGMRFDRHGAMVTDVLVDSGREQKRLKREIGRYVARYSDEEIARLMADAAENGTTGDCLACQLAMGADGSPLGIDHLSLHMEEGYTMATLAYHAVQRAGYRHPAVILHHSPDMVRRAIRRYMVETLTTSHGARPARDGMSEHWGS